MSIYTRTVDGHTGPPVFPLFSTTNLTKDEEQVLTNFPGRFYRPNVHTILIPSPCPRRILPLGIKEIIPHKAQAS